MSGPTTGDGGSGSATGPGNDPRSEPPLPEDEQARELLRAWKTPRGWRYWSAVNNKEVGQWYTAMAFVFFFFGGALALVMRAQLAVPENDLVSAELYNQLFTLHGSVMMFLFAVPAFEAVSILILPEMMGARDLPFPRLSAFGFWCFLIGGVFVCGSIFFGVAPEGGWFMYPPLTTQVQTGLGADIWLLGLSFIEIASLAAAVELLVGILRCRPPGMRLDVMPLYAWYVLVVAVMILFAFPPLIVGDLFMELERAFDWPFFDASRGGDPLLWQHLFWIFGHPEVYIVFLPSMALLATLLPTFARRPVVGYRWVVLGAVGTGFLSFGLWVHHMYTTGLPGVSLGFFSAASEAVAIPTAIQIFCFIATLAAGRVTRSIPLLYSVGGLAVFVLGGLTGVMVALVPFDLQAHDTHFVVSHLHYVLVGGTIFPILAALYYYYPLVRGRVLSERWGRVAFWILFVGFNVTFFPMHFTGLLGMPRRVFTYPDALGLGSLNLVSSVGAFILATGFLVILVDVFRSGKSRVTPGRNPWAAGSLEWIGRIPGYPWGIRSLPRVTTRYPLWEQPRLQEEVDEGAWYLAGAPGERRELMVTTAIDAEPLQCLRIPGPSFVPLVSAVFTGGAFILGTYHWWPLAGVSGALAGAAIVYWLWTGTGEIPEVPERDVGRGLVLPLYGSGPDSVGWWGMLVMMLGDGAAFAALVFGYFFYWTVHPDFVPSAAPGSSLLWPGSALAFALLAWTATLRARSVNRSPHRTLAVRLHLVGAALLAVAAAGCLVAWPWSQGLEPTRHAYDAVVWVIAGWTALHLAVGAAMLVYCLARSLAGRLGSRHDIDLSNVTLYWHFAAVTTLVAIGVTAGFPLVQ